MTKGTRFADSKPIMNRRRLASYPYLRYVYAKRRNVRNTKLGVIAMFLSSNGWTDSAASERMAFIETHAITA
jgi:hypothetical protein